MSIYRLGEQRARAESVELAARPSRVALPRGRRRAALGKWETSSRFPEVRRAEDVDTSVSLSRSLHGDQLGLSLSCSRRRLRCIWRLRAARCPRRARTWDAAKALGAVRRMDRGARSWTSRSPAAWASSCLCTAPDGHGQAPLLHLELADARWPQSTSWLENCCIELAGGELQRDPRGADGRLHGPTSAEVIAVHHDEARVVVVHHLSEVIVVELELRQRALLAAVEVVQVPVKPRSAVGGVLRGVLPQARTGG